MPSNEFWPEDDECTIYLSGEHTLESILELIQEKWPGVTFENIEISTEYIQTKCLTYDLYDPSDYTNFIIIRRKIEGGD